MAALFLGSYAVFASWALSGMEVTLTGLLLLAAIGVHLGEGDRESRRAAIASGLLMALATMARPESVLLFGTLLAARLLERLRSSRRGAILFTAAYGALYGPYFLWRWTYYGWFLPNTFYAKVGSTWEQVARGADYFERWSGASIPLLALALFGALAIVSSRLPRPPRVGVIPAAIVVHCAYVVAVGGDGQAAFRFFATVTPLLCLFAAIALQVARPPRAVLAIVVAAVVGFNLWQTYRHPEPASSCAAPGVIAAICCCIWAMAFSISPEPLCILVCISHKPGFMDWAWAARATRRAAGHGDADAFFMCSPKNGNFRKGLFRRVVHLWRNSRLRCDHGRRRWVRVDDFLHHRVGAGLAHAGQLPQHRAGERAGRRPCRPCGS